ncbi:Vitamin B12 ABC transporter, permease protein [Escherichia coli]|nr:Vitamin B12 ABC transporter, permease protein [Escherichia coli]
MLLALLLSLCAGEQWISPGDWFTPRGELFVWQIRLHVRWLYCWLVRRCYIGAVMQALFENPLAEPGLLGVSNGAGVGLIAAVLLGQGQLPNWA